MKHAFQRKCWWPLKLVQFDSEGKENTQTAVVQITVHPSAVMQAHREETMQLVRDMQAIGLMDALAKQGADPELAEARAVEAKRLKDSIEPRSQAVMKFLQESVHGWNRFCLEDGTETPFAEATRDELLLFQDFQHAVANALREASQGARTKN